MPVLQIFELPTLFLSVGTCGLLQDTTCSEELVGRREEDRSEFHTPTGGAGAIAKSTTVI